MGRFRENLEIMESGEKYDPISRFSRPFYPCF